MSWDISLFIFLNGIAVTYEWLSLWVFFFAEYFPDIVFASFLALLLFIQKERRQKALTLFTALGSIFIARLVAIPLIHIFITRPRPYLSLPVISLFQVPTYSFPSGHATVFFALAMSVFLFNKKWGVAFFIAALIISVARIMAGVHYPTDILGGAVLGSAVCYLVFKIFSFLNARML